MHLQIAVSLRRVGRELFASRAAMVAILVAALVGTTAIGVVGAATAGVIYACVNNSSGALKIVRAGETCPANWTLIQWNDQGPAGAQGPTGPQGETGATGPTGPQGAMGPTGPQGETGVTGATGQQGEPGTAGRDGAPGSVGATGPAGPQGATGPAGTIAGLSDLIGKPCNTGAGAGTVTLAYGGAPEYAVTVRCVPTSAATPTPMPTPTPTSGPTTLIISPSSYSFGNVVLGTSSTATFTVTNTGSTATSSSFQPMVIGLDAPHFSVTSSSCTGSLAPGGTCAVSLRFTPFVAGVKMATLLVSVSSGGSALATLTGVGVLPATLEVTPTTFSFGTLPVGASTQTLLTVRNTGGAVTGSPSVSLTPGIGSGMTIVTNSCTAALAPSAFCTVGVRFAPTAAGAATATLDVDATPGGSASATLSGNGDATILVHSNGFGGSYFHAAPLGTPGISATYTQSMALAAAFSLFVGAAPMPGTCGGNASYIVANTGVFTVWVYQGPFAGYARQTPFQATCPNNFGDRTWN